MEHELYYIGVTHKTAPLAVRESFRVDEERQRRMLQRLGALAPGRMILATCDRFEIYAHGPEQNDADWMARLKDWFHVPAPVLAKCVRTLRGVGAAEQLLRVAAGLESRIVGEPHVLGQVRRAYELAEEARSLGPVLSALCRAAVHVGKRVRSETGINRALRSIATVAVEALEAARGPLSERSVVVAGSGTVASDIAAALSAREVHRMTIVSRNLNRANELARRFGGMAQPLERLSSVIEGSDALIACTASPSYIVEASTVASLGFRPFLLDLSVPRNIDPVVGRLPGVRLVHFDDLLSGPNPRHADLAEAEALIEAELVRFVDWCRARQAAARIKRVMRKKNVSARVASRKELHATISRLKQEAAA